MLRAKARPFTCEKPEGNGVELKGPDCYVSQAFRATWYRTLWVAALQRPHGDRIPWNLLPCAARSWFGSVMSSVNEIYQHGHHTSVVSSHAKRTAETDAAFFSPHLKPGMRLLDVGCGPGSITVAGVACAAGPDVWNGHVRERHRDSPFIRKSRAGKVPDFRSG